MQNDTKWVKQMKRELSGTRFQGSVNDLFAQYAQRSAWKNPKKNRMDKHGRNITYVGIPQEHKDMVEGYIKQAAKEIKELKKKLEIVEVTEPINA